MIDGAIAGLVGSFIPKLIGIFENSLNNKYEIKMMEFQLQNSERIERMQLEETKSLAMIASNVEPHPVPEPEYHDTGNKTLNVLEVLLMLYNGTVRPTVTYAFVGLYLVLQYFVVISSVHSGMSWGVVAKTVLDGLNGNFIAAIIAYWFGHRSLYHLKRGNI